MTDQRPRFRFPTGSVPSEQLHQATGSRNMDARCRGWQGLQRAGLREALGGAESGAAAMTTDSAAESGSVSPPLSGNATYPTPTPSRSAPATAAPDALTEREHVTECATWISTAYHSLTDGDTTAAESALHTAVDHAHSANTLRAAEAGKR